MSEDGPFDPRAVTKRLADEFQEEDLGAMAWSGASGFHTLFSHEEGIDHALDTALHSALEFGLDSLLLDPGMIERHHGEVTPATARRELEDQLEQVYGLNQHSFFVQELGEAFEARLSGLVRAVDQASVGTVSSWDAPLADFIQEEDDG